jgi:hypothetical protein
VHEQTKAAKKQNRTICILSSLFFIVVLKHRFTAKTGATNNKLKAMQRMHSGLQPK